ncbi:putative coiled-coil protein SlyX [Bradyrhizobium embrapense]
MTEIERRIEQLEQTASERALVADLSTVSETRLRNAQMADELRLVAAQLRALRLNIS